MAISIANIKERASMLADCEKLKARMSDWERIQYRQISAAVSRGGPKGRGSMKVLRIILARITAPAFTHRADCADYSMVVL